MAAYRKILAAIQILPDPKFMDCQVESSTSHGRLAYDHEFKPINCSFLKDCPWPIMTHYGLAGQSYNRLVNDPTFTPVNHKLLFSLS